MELLVAGVNLLRPIVGLVVSMPGFLQLWNNGITTCALNTAGHSLLQKCGADFVSLDDFFDAVNRANTHFWFSFNKVASAIRGTGQLQLANVVDGIAYYGDATGSPMGVMVSTMKSVKIPIANMGAVITR